ncbi:hypothetical protein ACJVDH_20660 [Pedobacter sp. AW1-32]|uniref:hypothetical protein n=1 Tax=Pedobacter sp. AW1-32 TaxID=3383026 RepID=UPI003FF0437D
MSDAKRNFFKVIKWVSGIGLVIFFACFMLVWILNAKSRPFLSAQIKSLLYQSTDSLYTISFSNVSTNALTGNAVLHNVKIIPDMKRYRKLALLKRAPNNLYTVSLKKLSVKHFHPWILYRERKLQLEEVIFDKPDIAMVNRQFAFNEGRAPKPLQSPYTFISKSLAEFSIQKIRFNDVSFKYLNKNKTNTQVFAIDDLNITLSDLLIDSTSIDDPKRFYLLKDVLVNLNNYEYRTPDEMYSVKLQKLDFRASSGKLRVSKLSLDPLFTEMDFGRVAGYDRDRFNIQLRNVLMNGIDLSLYISKQELWAKEMSIANSSVAVFSNGSLKRKTGTGKAGRFPHQLLQHLSMPILVQKIQLKDVNVSYGVYNPESGQIGKLTFENTSGLIKNATNIDKIKAINPMMDVNLTSYFLGQGKLDVDFKFDLIASDGSFSYNGSLQNFNARALNRITKPLGLVKINRGNVDYLKFKFDANNLGSKGSVDFAYYDLSVALLRNDPEKDHLVKRGLLSFLANALIIHAENPDVNGKFTSATVNYEKPAQTSFFNMIWRSLYTGIKYSIGITEEKQNEMRAHIANFRAMQESHRERKLKRLKRRQLKEMQEQQK